MYLSCVRSRTVVPGLRCPEKLRLLVEYRELTQDWSAAIGKIVVRNSQSEYDRLSREADEARQRSIAARYRLARHIVEPGCKIK